MIYLLDTNVCVDVLRGRQEVIARLSQLSPDECAISAITFFELLSGARKSRDPARETGKVKRLVEAVVLVVFDDAAADHAAAVRSSLEHQGEKIGAYDTLIAGHALALDLICVTDHTKEFSRIDQLRLENWRGSA